MVSFSSGVSRGRSCHSRGRKIKKGRKLSPGYEPDHEEDTIDHYFDDELISVLIPPEVLDVISHKYFGEYLFRYSREMGGAADRAAIRIGTDASHVWKSIQDCIAL